MNIPVGKEEYHDIYPELNPPFDTLIDHVDRSGATAKGLVAAALLALMTGLVSVASLVKTAVVLPKVLSTTSSSALVEVQSDLTDTYLSYPLYYELVPYDEEKNPVSDAGLLLLSPEELEQLDPAVANGEVNGPDEELEFTKLSNQTDYILLLFSLDEEGNVIMHDHAVLIQLKRGGSGGSGSSGGASPSSGSDGTSSPSGSEGTSSPSDSEGTPSPSDSEGTETATPTPTPTPTATAPDATPVEIIVPGPTTSASATPYRVTTDTTPTPTPTPTARPRYSVSVSSETSNYGTGYLVLVDDSSVQGESIQARSGQQVKLVIVPGSGYAADDLALGNVSLSGAIQSTDDPYVFVMGSGNASISFSLLVKHTVTTYVDPDSADYGQGYVNGSSSIKALKGDTVTVSWSTRPGYGCEWGIWGSGEPQSISYDNNTFVMGDEDIEVGYSFYLDWDKLHDVEVSYYPSDSQMPDTYISISSPDQSDEMDGRFPEGSTVTISGFTPNAGYEFDYMTVDGVRQNGWSFTMGSTDAIVTIYCKPKTFTISATVTPSSYGTPVLSKTEATAGETISFSCTVTSPYQLSDVQVTGARSVDLDGGTLVMGTSDVSIQFTLELQEGYYNVSVVVEPSEGGEAYVSQTIAREDDSVSVYFAPNSTQGYRQVSYRISGGTYDPGSSTITVEEDVVLTLVCSNKYQLSISSSDGGSVSISPSPTDEGYAYGSPVTITATADRGYVLSSLTAGGQSLASGSSYTVTGDATVTATFTPRATANVTLRVIAPAPSPGTAGLSPGSIESGSSTYYVGETVTVTATPSDGFALETIVIDGNTYLSSPQSFTVGASGSNVTVNFSQYHYDVNLNYDSSMGSLTVSGPHDSEGYTYDQYVTVSATPNSGYRLVSLTANGTAISNGAFYVHGDTTVAAVFERVYSITWSSSEGGSVSGSETEAAAGEEISFTVSANAEYHITSVTVNGNSISVTNTQTMTFTHTVDGNVNVYATFEQD